ncbi:DUF4226 domain-containing protein [Nocardia sp. CA-119907]|uniref:DUF4226 domain-containing protein n=1 Tax=Nocardia sp. CA-119907 TaxID=3239973 RepID=UPI003D961A7B
MDPETLTALAPTAMMAGAMMLPMIASALAGLGGGGGSGSGSGGSGGEAGESGGLTPEAQKAIDVLKQLKDVYGTNDANGSDDSETPTGKKKLGSTTTRGTGSGATATKLRAHQLYQRNAATAFNNLDNDLVNYMRSMAGNHKIDKKAVITLLREVDTQLAEIGSAAYTKAGQQKVHQILTNALAKAAKIVSGGNAAATGTAAEINRLTNQYIYNLAGREYQAASSSGATSAAAQQAVAVAMAQQGDPYVWGAEGPGSFDCSGLMQYAARAAGVNIPRVAADQYRQLPKVNPADIRPGDLIFPDSEFNNGNPGHVMMYIGNGQCVEAPRTGLNVRVTNLPRSYHASRFS